MSVAAGAEAVAKAHFTTNARVEQMTVTIDLDATRLQDLKLELIAPGGTSSTLINYPQPTDTDGKAANLPTHVSYTLDTVRDWGEALAGEWTIKATNKITGSAVTLNNWSIKAYVADAAIPQAQIFTDEFSTFITLQTGRTTLASANGTQINAAAVTSASTLDLSGGASKIGGVAITLADPQNFVKILTGDGNDTLVGNALDNLLAAGRGSNFMDGGAGTDTSWFIGNRSDYDVIQEGNAYKVTSHKRSPGGVDLLKNVEKLAFGQTTFVAKSALDQTETVGSMYDALFNRAPDAQGLKGWTNSIVESGSSELSVARSMTRAVEDGVNEWTNARFVTEMYENALERIPDAEGYAYWLATLEKGSADRGDVLLGFINSAEFEENYLELVAVSISELGDIW